MADRSSSYSLSWFIIGFLAGVAATLAVLIWSEGRSARREAAAEAAASAAAPAPVRKPALAARHAQALPPASAAQSPDEQVNEDAAAAGMTSRTHGPPSQ